jgi:hypothetical protein
MEIDTRFPTKLDAVSERARATPQCIGRGRGESGVGEMGFIWSLRMEFHRFLARALGAFDATRLSNDLGGAK